MWGSPGGVGGTKQRVICIYIYGWLSELWSLFGYPKYWVPYYDRDPKSTIILTTTHIHTYIHAYIHTYIRTYIHTYIHACLAFRVKGALSAFTCGLRGFSTSAPNALKSDVE